MFDREKVLPIDGVVEIIDVGSNKIIDKLRVPWDLSKLKMMVRERGKLFIRFKPRDEYYTSPFFMTLTSPDDVDNLEWILKDIAKNPRCGLVKKDKSDYW